ncbi:MAG: methyl-accepting chemotaxis protein [Magnetospirillum sp.]|nr:methyl-accepting chemotaxis protein [Magnetospirillum sp.]
MWSKMRLGHRLGLGFAVGVLLTAVVGMMALKSADDLSSLTENLYEDPFAVTNALAAANADIVAMRASMRSIYTGTTTAGVEQEMLEVNTLDKRILAQFALVKERYQGDMALVDKIIKDYEAWRPVRNELFEIAKDEDRLAEAGALGNGRAAFLARTVAFDMDKVMESAQESAKTFMDNARATQRRIRLFTIVMLAGAALVGAVVAVAATRSITRPLAVLRDTMGSLSSGHLGADIPGCDRRDEIGEMARVLLVFRDGLLTAERLAAEQEAQRAEREKHALAIEEMTRQFDQEIADTLKAVSGAAVEMERTAQTMSQIAERTNVQATTVATATEQATANVETVATAAEELSSSAGEIGRQVERSTRVSQSAADEAERTTTMVQGLAEAAGRIGDVVSLINHIAGQTNLLALNASIEIGPRRRGRQRLRRGRQRGQGAGQPDRQGHRGDRRPDQRRAERHPRRGRRHRGHRHPHPRDQRDRHHHRRRHGGTGRRHPRDRPQRHPGGGRHPGGRQCHRRRHPGGRRNRQRRRRGVALGARAAGAVEPVEGPDRRLPGARPRLLISPCSH